MKAGGNMDRAPSRLQVSGRECLFYSGKDDRALIIQPVDRQEMDTLDKELNTIASLNDPAFGFIAFVIESWNSELSPWDADPVFGKEPFGHGARDTLSFITDELLRSPVLSDINKDIPLILGGYSLAGLFSLWAACESGRFCAVMAASPSVWFPGWTDYLSVHPVNARHVYLSLGDREEKTRNPVMSTVGENIKKTFEIIGREVGCFPELEWNPGNHFSEPGIRCAKGFARCLEWVSPRDGAGS